jgi:Mo-dependent nitrogenase C-terminus
MEQVLRGNLHKRSGSFEVLNPIRQWINRWSINNRLSAHRICKFIPAQCPFERDIKLFGYTVLHIPPLCKLNPFFEELVGLRFRALCYLADECGEDVTQYC